MKKNLFILTFLFLPLLTIAKALPYPSWFLKRFKQDNLHLNYSLSNYIKPTYLNADFNGDNIPDVAALIVQRKTNKKGIIIMLARINKYFILGAGQNFGNGSDNFQWIRKWNIYNKSFAWETVVNKDGDLVGARKIKLSHAAILTSDLIDGESNSGGIINWSESKFIWIQQGE
ncbi:MAG: hypothetical protein ACTHJ8_08195 [Mucilaginibacter sp.]